MKTSARLEKSAVGKDVVVVHFAVEKPWHIYANPVGNEGQERSRTTIDIVGKTKPKSVQVTYPRGSDYEEFGEKFKVYEGSFDIRAVVEREPGDKGPLEAVVRFGACKHLECLLPAIVRVPECSEKGLIFTTESQRTQSIAGDASEIRKFRPGFHDSCRSSANRPAYYSCGAESASVIFPIRENTLERSSSR